MSTHHEIPHFSTEVKKLATILHKTCKAEHQERCAWYYGEVHRVSWYEKAEKILPKLKELGISLETLDRLIEILKGLENW